ncbi:transposase [Niabella soli]|uniref:transposase n=1 Tax=Niabella soli TaxID=446683 RepID=UPI001FDF74F1|nr:transposase [Niabella soli]
MSYHQIFYQIIFATKNRCKTITEAHCEELYKYIWGIIKNKKCKLYRINGTEDHIHIFSDLHPSISLADYIYCEPLFDPFGAASSTYFYSHS